MIKKLLLISGVIVISFVLLIVLHCFVMKDEDESLESHLCVHSGLCEGEPSIPYGSESVR